MASTTTSMIGEQSESSVPSTPVLSSSLKFVLSNLKNTVQNPLSPDNYPLWSSQILKICRANGLESLLDPLSKPPSQTLQRSDGLSAPNPAYAQWVLNDQNLAAALCSTISASILPYVLNLDTTSAIWANLQTRFQSTNRSKVIQLKNALHNVSLKNLTMVQYLNEVKSLVDQISAAGGRIDEEDIILYILRGLPPSYQSFKTSIRTMTQPLNLDQLYAFLITEEIHMTSEASNIMAPDSSTMALLSNRGRGRRNRGRSYAPANVPKEQSTQVPTCQICLKRGHTATDCWHRMNAQFIPKSRPQTKALLADQSSDYADWYLDSGASSHLTKSLDNLAISNPYTGTDSITLGDGSSVGIAHSGKGVLPTPSRKLNLSKIFHSPSIHYNLLSISQLTKDNNIAIIFDPSGFTFKDLKTQRVIFQGPCREGLYPLRAPLAYQQRALHANSTASILWHNRTGHPSRQTLHKIASSQPHLHIVSHSNTCHSCNTNKNHKLVFEPAKNRSTKILELLHSDVWGPAPVKSNSGYLYYVLFIDDCTRFTWLFPMQHKSEVSNIFITFKSYIEKLTSRKIKSIRTDGGGEYVNHAFTRFLQLHGISHQISCPHTPEQNGVSERKHRHLIETTRTLMHTASVPYSYWPDAVLTATYLVNRMPSPNTNGKSPFELFHHRVPDYEHLRTFGCACFPLTPASLRNKLQPTSQLCVFLGYAEQYKGYKCFDLTTHKITISRHVTFDESYFPFLNKSSTVIQKQTDNISPYFLTPVSVVQKTNTATVNNSRPTDNPHTEQCPVSSQDQLLIHNQSSQTISTTNASSRTAPHPMLTRYKTGSLKSTNRLNLFHNQNTKACPTDPSTYAEASKFLEWRQAMAAEFLALQTQGTWTLIPRPPNSSILGCKWTYRTKRHSDGSIAKYKARLVAQGNHQEYGLDYTETFSPVVKLPTIRILLAIALHRDWPVHQMDVANAFLHGSLNETVYMSQPKGFEDNNNPDYVCRLNKAIYGLKQAPRQWYNTFTSFLLSIGFTHSKSDSSLFIFRKQNITLFLLVYVDDILFTGNDANAISNIIHQLHGKFAMKQLGRANSFLGIQIRKETDKYFLSQETYARSLLQMAQLTRCNSLSNPTCTKLPKDFQPDPILGDPTMYRKLTGALQYLCLTRPDIAYSVNLLSQHMHQPMPEHTYLLKRLLRYIKGTLQYGIPITKSNLLLTSFSDADWASDPISRKSTTGYCSFLGDSLISWTVKKQTTVARSSTESEYRALAALTADIAWLRRLLTDFGISQDKPTELFCDNTSAIALANNPVFHARTKHIEIDHRFVRDHIQQQNIRILPISTTDQIADILTKSLSTPRFHLLRDKLTVQKAPSTCGGILEN
ncbi:Retrovirus-related Pol polyprotein from transposon TNT 1-94 [Dendrobium catenatum]|uniref:Retrovirus-related Pol polyprotein from transposon TNT 1-94 n=1 Tax=Dendrobium catenatum TaxID=906689 RepID=A0A2I0WK82_9ASPA|nr:Retrovirus-related Pol polyprotein from transposon TNT 1-94 [Dendrobium catenatum]